MQIELLKDNAIEFRGKFCYMWLMVLKPIYKQFIESCICPMLYRKSDVTLLYGTFPEKSVYITQISSEYDCGHLIVCLWKNINTSRFIES